MYWHRLLEALLLPPFGPLLCLLLGLLIQPWRRRLGMTLVWAGALLSVLLILPASVSQLLQPLESAAPVFDPATAGKAQAIVILGGGRKGYALEYAAPTVNRLTLERLRYGAHLARQHGLPVLVSGGVAGANHPEAQMMAHALRNDFGIKPRWLEDRSANTAENARFSAELLKKADVQRIILVTHAAHMRRALGYFDDTDLQVIPAPMGFFGPLGEPGNSLSFLPSANSAYAGWYAAHEWAGLFQQWLSE